jgi:non-ribosomal peptide synthetase component F
MSSAMAGFDPRRTMHSYFADIARVNADRPDATVISYADLDRRSNRFARLLASKGVRPGSIVGLFLPRSPEAVIAMLGALKVGAAFAPLDPAYPADYLAFIASDAAPAVVVSASHMFSVGARPWTAPTVYMDLKAQAIVLESDAPLAENVAGDDLA